MSTRSPTSDASPEELARWDREHVVQPWRAQAGGALMVVRAEGTRFWDDAGRSYLDFTSQLVYANLGHAVPELADTAAEQLRTLPAMASMFATPARARLGRLLAEVTPGDLNRSFFSTSGAEANEAALKIARAATGRPTVVTRYRSYHGSTAGAAAVTRDPRMWESAPSPGGTATALDPYCYRCPFGLTFPGCNLRCADHVRDVIRWNGGADCVAAVIVEPVTGANGVIVPPDGYLQRIREICNQEGVLLVADEVMVGFGRTGRWFACDHWGVVPDILTLSKGLTNGELPFAATVLREGLAAAFDQRPLLHGHTASGNTTACAVAVRAIEIYRDRGIMERAREMGTYLRERALWLQERHRCVGDVRGLGLFFGLEIVRDRASRTPIAEWPARFPTQSLLAGVLGACRERGVFFMSSHPSVIHLAPPLTVTHDEIDEAIAALDEALVLADAHCEAP